MTDTIRHHLSDKLLMGYSAGALPEAFSLAVASHVSMCDECRARLAAFDAVGGALMEGCGDADLSDTAFSDTLARIDAIDLPVPEPTVHETGTLPHPVQEYIGGDLDAVKWKSVGMGVKQAILPTSKEATARLLFIPAGAAVPDHGHRGTELTLVLQGAFADEVDRFGPGDIEIADEDLDHTPVAEIGADCICLAVTDAPLRFRGLIPRIAQPFLRI
ncbi:ChrR family anti-sigma-E factor [Roseovarius sp. B08]|uniref:ChrR family anti-sigma-E factor n=1 Tax=Roseovarius sp. B08 TaxID=3449223 RepID=UPI003EDC02AF